MKRHDCKGCLFFINVDEVIVMVTVTGSSLCLSIVSSRVTVFSSRVTTVVRVVISRVTVDRRVRRFPPLSRLSMKIALNGR